MLPVTSATPPRPPTRFGPVPWAQRLRHAALNAVVFGLCYPSANLLAHQQGVMRSVATPLDLHIPFVAWMVLPYLLSGVFFTSSFVVVRSVHALRALSQRLLMSTVLGCVVFVLLPLRFSLIRPGLEPGLLAGLYAVLGMVDRPYNQLPSLHVAYCCIFWGAWRPVCATCAARAALGLTLALVAVSTLFTYQHHLLDVGAGIALGWACVRWVSVHHTGPWVAFYYTLGAGVVVVLGLAWWPGWLTAYGTISLLLVARVYARRDARFLHKSGGRLPRWVWLLYAPYLLGYQLTWLCVQWRERNQPPFAELAPGLWVGRRLSQSQAKALPPGCVVVDLANELNETPALRTHRYYHVPLLDLVTPSPDEVARVLALVHDGLQSGHPVYLHCAMGYSRSRHMAGAYLARYPTPDAAP